ncbi:MAG: hypothetical protein CME15_16125 [Gemmatimonadetes bacterium]|nr:hypothetical protein [Gemmatimonadota bacterium]
MASPTGLTLAAQPQVFASPVRVFLLTSEAIAIAVQVGHLMQKKGAWKFGRSWDSTPCASAHPRSKADNLTVDSMRRKGRRKGTQGGLIDTL